MDGDSWLSWFFVAALLCMFVAFFSFGPGVCVWVVAAELLPVSSTEIREKVRCGESIAGLVPDSIVDEVKRLYKG